MAHRKAMKMTQVKKVVQSSAVHHQVSRGPPLPPLNINYNLQPIQEEMDTYFTKPPFALPKSARNHAIINDLLMYSLQQQREEDVSDNSAFVVLVIHRCLDAMNISNQIVHGHRHLKEKCIPYMWLKIQGQIIDNTYFVGQSNKDIEILMRSTASCYEECSLEEMEESSQTKEDDDLGCESNELLKHIIAKQMSFYYDNPDKSLALCLNREQSYNYFFSMIRFVWESHKVLVTGIDPKIRVQCWYCECVPEGERHLWPSTDKNSAKDGSTKDKTDGPKGLWKFPQCGKCTVATYCSLKCQTYDWRETHNYTCVGRTCIMMSNFGDMLNP